MTSLWACIWLVSWQYFSGDGWQSLTGKQKHVVCLSLYYATNWIRELVSRGSMFLPLGCLFSNDYLIWIVIPTAYDAISSLMLSVHKSSMVDLHVQLRLQERKQLWSCWNVWGTSCMFSLAHSLIICAWLLIFVVYADCWSSIWPSYLEKKI